MKRLLFSTVAAVTMLTLHLSCSDKGMDPEEIADGKFEATISGDFDMTLKGGCAAFVSLPGYLQLGLATFEPSNPNASISFARESSSIPSVGTYSIGEDAASSSSRNFIGLVFYANGQADETYISDSGSMTVSQSSSGGFSGSFNFTALAGTRKISVTGRFNAIPAPCR